MSEPQAETYQCPSCGRDFPWRPESAGRTIHCHCAAVLVVPFAPGAAERTDHAIRARAIVHEPPGEIPLAPPPTDGAATPVAVDDGSCPQCHAPMRIGAVVCTQCGFRRRRPKQRLLRRRSQIESLEPLPSSTTLRRAPIPPMEAMGLSTFWDLVVPGMVAVAGLLLEVVLLAEAFRKAGFPWTDALAYTPLLILLAIGAVAAVFLCDLVLMPLFDLSFGPLEPLVPKLAAAVIFPAAAGAMIEVAFNNNATGIAIGWVASAVLYLLLFRLLFDFEWPDAMVLIASVCLAHAGVLFLVLWPLTLGPMPLTTLWTTFGPIIFQSLATFTLTGALIIPHFRRE